MDIRFNENPLNTVRFQDLECYGTVFSTPEFPKTIFMVVEDCKTIDGEIYNGVDIGDGTFYSFHRNQNVIPRQAYLQVED